MRKKLSPGWSNIFFLSRKQLLVTAFLSLGSELIVTGTILLAEYFNILDARSEVIILWVIYPLVSIGAGWLSRQLTGNWFVALLAPLLVFTAYFLMLMDNYVPLVFVPVYMAFSLGGYFLAGVIRKRRSIGM